MQKINGTVSSERRVSNDDGDQKEEENEKETENILFHYVCVSYLLTYNGLPRFSSLEQQTLIIL